MIYFDNASTGGFKPRAVTDATETILRYLSANPTRSAHRLALTGANIVSSCREEVAKTFNSSFERVIFTKNCTEALNTAIFGSVKKSCHVITTVYEHNSVLRPLFALKKRGDIKLDVVFPSQKQTIVDAIKEKIRQDTYLIITTAVSNVNGETLPVREIGALAKKHDILYFVDGAQGGGHVGLSLKDDFINALALASHKGLYGIMGSGVLVIDDQLELSPLMYGGTGSESFNLLQPDCYPERLEAGTLNLPAISALNEGIRYVRANLENFAKHLVHSTTILIEKLSAIPRIKCYSSPNESGIVAFSVENYSSEQVADILNSEFDVAVRGGFHCAPLMHKFLKTDKDGLVRASLAVQNSSTEINYFVRAIEKIASNI